MPQKFKSGYSKTPDTFRDKKCKYAVGDQGIDTMKSIDENSEVIKCFKEYAAQLDEYHDRYERIVKISRDIVVESKRIIFLLHTCDGVNKREKALQEAETRLNSLVKVIFFKIANELKGEDPYNFHRAFTFGLQEFIEAYTFFHYLKDKRLYHWDYYQNLLKFKDPKNSEQENESLDESNQGKISENEILATLPPSDYILGVADLSGELMRRCNNNVGLGNIDECFDTCNTVRNLYAGFLSLTYNKTIKLSSKILTLRRSLLKMEKVCYNLFMRSKEPGDGRMVPLFTELECSDRDEEF